MNLRYLLIILFTVACAIPAYSQWDAQISQYWRAKTYFNPAFAGETENLQATLLHRQQWIGITNAPKTLLVMGDMPLNFLGRVHGVGAIMMTESIGLFSNTMTGAQYTYKKNFKNKGSLNFGVQIGIARIGFDASKIEIVWDEETDDAMPTGDQQASTFDANFGVTWITPNYYVGLSTTHVTKPSFDLGDNYSSFIARAFYLTGGYNIQFQNSLYELQPSFLVKSDAVVTQYDVTARVVYNKMFNGGISWRKDDGFVFLLGIKYKAFDAGYAYDLSTSEISKASSGTHEFFVRYSMPIKLGKTEKNRHRSVRIL